MNDYNILQDNVELDKVRAYAALQNDYAEREYEMKKMRRLISKHQKLQEYTWKTREGIWIAVKDLENDHLTNILRMLVESGQDIPEVLVDEAKERKIIIPKQGRFRVRDFEERIEDLPF